MLVFEGGDVGEDSEGQLPSKMRITRLGFEGGDGGGVEMAANEGG